jgi:hypothetical protein
MSRTGLSEALRTYRPIPSQIRHLGHASERPWLNLSAEPIGHCLHPSPRSVEHGSDAVRVLPANVLAKWQEPWQALSHAQQ